jgi:hypothetical protein
MRAGFTFTGRLWIAWTNLDISRLASPKRSMVLLIAASDRMKLSFPASRPIIPAKYLERISSPTLQIEIDTLLAFALPNLLQPLQTGIMAMPTYHAKIVFPAGAGISSMTGQGRGAMTRVLVMKVGRRKTGWPQDRRNGVCRDGAVRDAGAQAHGREGRHAHQPSTQAASFPALPIG